MPLSFRTLMASLSRKFSCLQEGATEFDFAAERIPAAEDVSVVTTAANTLIGADLQDVLDKLSRPTVSQVPVYTDNDITSVTFYKNSTQTVLNRIVSISITYSSGLPSSEVWTMYSDTDGTTVLKIVTFTYTFTSGNLTNMTSSTV